MKIFFSASTFAAILLLLIGSGACTDREYRTYIDKVEGLPDRVDFNYHIKPILSDRCFACHGPDKNSRSTDFRLDTEEGAFAALTESKGSRAIVPGDPHNSEIFRRIVSDDPDYRMPTPESNLTLSDREIALIAKWIEQGAEWKKHWSFLPLEEQKLPKVKNADWPVNPIDNFVLSRLEQEGISPAPEADRERLLRRVTLDLTGLPPTLEEIDAFLADKSADAYEKVVDRLLASSAYGERMATNWMDVSRYGDSHGYQADGLREMWPWRDWVIRSFNQNLPFDKFITWQLAGDLLDNPTREQILATGFNRNHAMNSEAGAIDGEFRQENVFDRTNTFGVAFMGLTMECARCHDHKYDPISQKEYFQLSAFFNNIDELGVISSDGNAGPTVLLPDEEVEKKLKFIEDQIASQERALAEHTRKVAEQNTPGLSARYVVSRDDLSNGLVGHYPLDEIKDGTSPNLANPKIPARVSGQPSLTDGVVGRSLEFDDEYEFITLPKVGMFEKTQEFSITVWVKPGRFDHYQEILGNAGTKNPYWRGWEVFLDSANRVTVRLTHALPHNYIQVTTKDALKLNEWTHFAFTYDGSGRADGLRLYFNGKDAATAIEHDNLYKSILPVTKGFTVEERGVRVAKSYRAHTGDNGVFQGGIDDIRIYSRRISQAEVVRIFGQDPPVTAVKVANAKRNAGADDLILDYYLSRYDKQYQEYVRELFRLRSQHLELISGVQEVMVMREMDTPRKTYVLNRGMWDSPAEEVHPGTPAALPGFDEDFPSNRLGLAQWLVHPRNPLFARVTVNRFWMQYFGLGLVRTPDDFGSQGALPTHPELLDWLAYHFIRSGWDLKALNKLVVMSATYRQSSIADEGLLSRDPHNELLARGPSFRLTAEMLRDQALAASGLLVRKVGGPSVKPYQPEGLWEEKGEFSHFLLTYNPDKGEGLYRRSLYTFWRRTSPPPAMLVFDAGSRYQCTVQRQTTNSPQQALVLLNDPQFVEASRVIAERMMKEGGPNVESRISYAFRLLTSRRPTDQELVLLSKLYQEEIDNYRKDREAALSLLGVGEYVRDQKLNPVELAANSVVASVIMNHDEAYSKR